MIFNVHIKIYIFVKKKNAFNISELKIQLNIRFQKYIILTIILLAVLHCMKNYKTHSNLGNNISRSSFLWQWWWN